jgi:hypothetical protein
MALIIETGNKQAGANSYVTVEFADAYHSTYGNTDWAGDTTLKEQALIVACQSLELLYGPKYASSRQEGVQSLLWPRYSFYDRNGNTRIAEAIPAELKNAQAELALMYLNGAGLFPEGNTTASIAQEQVSVGDISTSTTYNKAGKQEQATYEGFRKIDLLLWPILKGRQSITFMSR